MTATALRAEEQAAPYFVAPQVTDHLDTFASAPDGFKRLRELVLNLAVRGRLVPQDPGDEPAVELLRRIADDKATLLAAGSIKAEKFREEAEHLFDIPDSWQWVQLQDLAWPQAGFAFKANLFNEVGDGLPLIRIRDVGADGVGTYFSGEYREEFCVKNGDWLVSMDGQFRVARWHGPRALLNQRVSRLIFFGKETQQRLICVSLQHELLKLQGLKAYTTVDHLSGGQISSRPIPLPPAAEQARIVAKVEELMALIDRLEAKAGASDAARGKLLETLLAALADSPDAAATAEAWAQLAPHFDLLLQTPADVDHLQQTLLTLAVKGRLVPQDPNDEPAAELLKRIRAEKERLIAGGEIKRDKPLPAIEDSEIPYPLPQGWLWVRVPAIAETRLGKMLDKAKNRGHLKPYLRNTNVQWFRFDLSDIKELRLEDDELSEFRVLPGDLLICEGGEPGRCAIWRDGEREIYFQKALHRVRTYGGVLPEFMQLCLRVDCASGWLQHFFTGATIKHFPGQQLESYCVPLPPLAEQSRIVAAVTSLTVLCDRLRERLAARRDLSAKLAAALAASALQ